MASVDLPEPPFWVAKAIVRIAMAFPSEHSDQTESDDKIAAASSDHGRLSYGMLLRVAASRNLGRTVRHHQIGDSSGRDGRSASRKAPPKDRFCVPRRHRRAVLAP